MAETLVNKTQAGEGIWTQDNLVAGSGISIQQVPQPVIDENTVALFHFDGNTNNEINNNYTVDSSLQPFAFDSVHYKYGGYSAYPSSASYSAITSNITGISGDFTIDFWARSTGSDGLIFYVNGSAFYYIYPCYSDNTARIHINRSSGGSTTVDTTEFNHFAIVHKDSHPYFFINGKLVYSNTSGIYTNPTNSLKLQVPHSSKFPIFLDELRVSNIARWTSDFIPYTVPYSASAGTTQYAINNTKADPDLSSYLQNTATGYSSSLTILGTPTTADSATNIGDGANALQGATCVGSSASANNTGTFATCIGTIATASATHGVALGRYARVSGNYGIAIGGAPSGSRTSVSNTDGIAIGHTASATAQAAIQLGTGTNSTANTFKVFNTTVVDASGKVPMSSTDVTSLTGYDATKTQVLKNVNGTLTWVDEA